MATVATRIQRALRLLGVLESGETPSTSEYADALVALNSMIGTWRNDGLMVYALQTESLTLAASTASYTIGLGGSLSTTRPVSIEQAWVDVSNVSYEVRLIGDDEYNAIADKTTTSDWPDRANYRPSMSTATLYVWPVPNATRTMKLSTRVVVAEFSATSDSVTLPPGWERVIDSNLAIELAPEYQVQASAEVAKMARESLAAVKGTNSRPLMADCELGLLLGGARPNITIGE